MMSQIEVTPDSVDDIFKHPLIITQQLFSLTDNNNIEELLKYIQKYIQSDPFKTVNIKNILKIFSVVRQKQHDLLKTIENSISITITNDFKRILFYFQNIFPKSIPKIFRLDSIDFPLCIMMKGKIKRHS